MRVESGRVPDIDTFAKICRWLGVDPGVFLGFTPQPDAASGPSDGIILGSAHFKADQNPNPDTAQALARMILHAVRRQRPAETNVDV
jgi:hypothetical protein